MTMKMKRAFGFLLTMALVLSLLPGMIMTAKAAEIVIDSTTTEWKQGNTYVLNENIEITGRIVVDGEATLVLNAGCTLTASKGINVAVNNKLIIEGSGTLIASANADGQKHRAGIGSSQNQNCGTVIINGGTIIANKDSDGQAAGIGGGLGGANGGNGGIIEINGGKVMATGAGGGAGIGGGPGKSAVRISITGGEIDATGSADSAAIGGGSEGSCGEINISGGKITATGIAGPGIGSGRNANQEGINKINITGGEVTAVAKDLNNHDEAIGKGGSSKDVTVTIGSGVSVFSSNTAITDVKQVPENMRTTGPYQNVTVRAHYMTVKKMDKAKVSTPPKAVSGLTYIGSAQELVTAGTASGGTLQYAIGTSATTAPTFGWSASIPTATNVGTYFVWYKVVGDANHNDSDPKCVSVTINATGSPDNQNPGKKDSDNGGSNQGSENRKDKKTEKITISKRPSSIKAKAKKSKVTVSWKKIKKNKAGKNLLKQIESIQVQYSTDKTFKKNVKTKTVGKKKTKATLKLQKKTTYYVRVRYKGSNGFSKWSAMKKVTTKK